MNLQSSIKIVLLWLFFICLLLEKGSGKSNFPLHDALRKDNVSNNELEKLVNSTSDSNLNSEDHDGRTPLFLAASRGNAHIFRLIQARSGDGNFTNRHEETLLHHAVIGGDIDIINDILDLYEISLSAQDSEGNTVMHYVAQNKTKKNAVSVCEKLLEEGAILSIKNNENRTPFHLAVINHMYEILERMLNSTLTGVLIQDENGHTPLQIALDKKYKDIFTLLINNNVNPFEKDFDDRTVIHNAILNGEIDLIRIALSNKTFRGEANRIISYQEGLGYQDLLNYTALHLIAEKGIEELLPLILTFKKCETTNRRHCKDLVLKTTNYYDDTIVHGAVRGGKAGILRELLEHFEEQDSYIDQQNKDGQTPLHLAVQDGKNTMVELLLLKHSNITVKDNNDFHPLGLAASFSKLDMLDNFKRHIQNLEGYNVTELLGFAVANSNDDVIEELLQDLGNATYKINPEPTFLSPAMGLDNETKQLCNNTCTITIVNCTKTSGEEKKAGNIMHIITGDHEKFIKELAEEDEDESSDLFKSKPTMLNYALFFNGKLSTIKQIIECAGAMAICQVCEINEAWSPVDIAAFRGKLDVLEYIIEMCKKQCKISLTEVRDNQQQTVMHKAAWGGQCSILEYLHTKQNADINSVDNWGRTPLHIAALRGYKPALSCILRLNNTSLNWKDQYEFTPLHLAEIYGHHNFFTALQRTSITVDPQVRYKMKYPGTHNRLRNHTDAILFLLEKGANPNAQDGTLGWTTLHWAAANGDMEVVKMLVNNKIKAKVNLPSKSDQTPMYLARFWGRVDVYNYLKAHSAVW